MTSLLQTRVGERLAVGRNDVDAVGVAVRVEQLPNDFLFAVHLEHAHLAGVSLGVAADDSVAVGQALTSARIGNCLLYTSDAADE